MSICLFSEFGTAISALYLVGSLCFGGLCYTVLLITFASEKGLSVAALKSALTMFKAVLSSSSSRAAAHICGHVLGLRILRAARIVEVTVRARQAPEYDWEAGHRLASSPAVGTGEQATGRVDVPGEAYNELYKQKVCTVALQHATVLTERYGGCVDKCEKDSSLIPIFVRDLFGKSVSLRVPSQVTGGELSTTVSGVTGVLPEFFHLTIGGRIVGGQDLL